MVEVSIVTTLFMSSKYVDDFYLRILSTLGEITDDYEIVFVNDGSPDDSLEKVIAFSRSNSKVKVVDLSRNFGHHKAVMAGLAHAKGDKVFLIDSDLEEPPEILKEFYQEFNQFDGDVVFGIQKQRKSNWLNRTGGALFYAVLNKYSKLDFENRPLTVRMMSRRYVDSVLLYKESELFLAGIFCLAGFKQRALLVDKGIRGETTYSFSRRFGLLLTGITSFTSFPLKWIFLLGIFISFSSFLGGVFVFFRKLYYGELVDVGWTSLIISIWFLGGLIMISIGTVGLYLSKVFLEVKNRPGYVVRKIYGVKDK